jgi:hypothetical protein
MSRSSSPERPVFIAHQLCPPHLRRIVEDTVESFNNDWLVPPEEGEVFESGKECMARLQGFALSRGFAVVTIASTANRFRFACIHHGDKTKNWRALEQHVPKDPESKQIISQRQREETSTNARGCGWKMYWSVRSVGKRGSGVKAGQLGITNRDYTHILAPNPFIYRVHQKATPQYQQAVALALGHRLAY